jgi:hypothetical protein
VEVPPAPSTYINPPSWPPSLIYSSLQSSPLWLGSLVWSCACELEEIPPTGHRRAARFSLQVLLLLLLRWTGARGMSIHQTCVELRRCCHLWHLSLSTYSTTWPWGRFRLSPSTMFVRERLSHFWSLRYEHHRYSVALQLCRIDYGITSKDFFLFSSMNPNNRTHNKVTSIELSTFTQPTKTTAPLSLMGHQNCLVGNQMKCTTWFFPFPPILAPQHLAPGSPKRPVNYQSRP